MRAFLFLAAVPLCACQAIVGSYEVGESDSAVADTAKPDISVSDTNDGDSAKPDTAVADTADTGRVVKSCKQLLAENPGLATTNGPQKITEGIDTFCDMKGGGWTLVATRSSTTNGSVWAGGEAALKKNAMGPNDDLDGVLDVDWTLLKFTDVAYELGLAPGTGMRTPRTRATFPMLAAKYHSFAKPALFAHLVGGEQRPDCILSMGGTPYKECIIPMGTVLDGGTMPPQSLGWLFAPNGVECFFAYPGKVGTQDCVTGAVGGGRIFVK